MVKRGRETGAKEEMVHRRKWCQGGNGARGEIVPRRKWFRGENGSEGAINEMREKHPSRTHS